MYWEQRTSPKATVVVGSAPPPTTPCHTKGSHPSAKRRETGKERERERGAARWGRRPAAPVYRSSRATSRDKQHTPNLSWGAPSPAIASLATPTAQPTAGSHRIYGAPPRGRTPPRPIVRALAAPAPVATGHTPDSRHALTSKHTASAQIGAIVAVGIGTQRFTPKPETARPSLLTYPHPIWHRSNHDMQ